MFGKPIQQEVAKRAYLEFVREGLVTPEALIEAGRGSARERLRPRPLRPLRFLRPPPNSLTSLNPS
ncbi:hypothetical protein [Candidatus Methylomirabilis sp.]|uniref:hypothetical protein n=1 Tax=Candidatus Methylomirabilis sp. TaxID=2032687 RepID=UPI003C7536CC